MEKEDPELLNKIYDKFQIPHYNPEAPEEDVVDFNEIKKEFTEASIEGDEEKIGDAFDKLRTSITKEVSATINKTFAQKEEASNVARKEADQMHR